VVTQPAREGPADAATTIIVLDPPEDPPGPMKRSAEPLDRSQFVGKSHSAAIAGPVMRARVTVDDDLLELPHDNWAALRDFVESLYVLYGWPAVIAVEEELAMMRKLREKPDEVARESGLPVGAPSGGIPGSQGEAGALISPPRTTTLRDETLPGGVALMEEQPPVVDRATQGQLAKRVRYDELRRRIVLADTLQVRAWDEAFRSAFERLRVTVLVKMRSFEEEALAVAGALLDASREQVVDQVKRYFQWEKRGQIEFALKTIQSTAWVAREKEDVIDLRARIAKLQPAAQGVLDAEKAEESFRESRTMVVTEDRLPEVDKKELARMREEIEAKKAAYGTALVVEAAEHPVLFRFDAPTTVKALTPNDLDLGRILFSRLRKTWDAQLGLREDLREKQVAKETKIDRVQAGELPESLVGNEAKESVWAYPPLLEKTFAQLPPDKYAFLQVAIPNMHTALVGRERADAVLGIVTGIGLAGLQLGMMAVCPPAGIALDVALSATDVVQAATERRKGSNAAFCVLDPREALTEAEPSVMPLVFAVAGAAMVAL
jgi:hypothetical protein